VLVVGVDHRAAAVGHQRLEQPQLRREIGLDRRMVVEMIAAEIGEGAGRDPDAVEPVLVEPVRGRLDREMRDALARQPSSVSCSATGSGVVCEP
jgi:hypothetical protein